MNAVNTMPFTVTQRKINFYIGKVTDEKLLQNLSVNIIVANS